MRRYRDNPRATTIAGRRSSQGGAQPVRLDGASHGTRRAIFRHLERLEKGVK